MLDRRRVGPDIGVRNVRTVNQLQQSLSLPLAMFRLLAIDVAVAPRRVIMTPIRFGTLRKTSSLLNNQQKPRLRCATSSAPISGKDFKLQPRITMRCCA